MLIIDTATDPTPAPVSGRNPRDEASCWEAVLRRDPAMDDVFVYAVKTTGIYCRPSCPSRRPRRENTGFHPDPASAEAAGYRACRRCRPDHVAPPADPADAVTRACRLIAEAETPMRLDELAARAGLSRSNLLRLFRAATGLTPRGYAAGLRAERARETLAQGAEVTQALYAAGFNASSRFYAEADAQLGMRPGRYRDGGQGMTIRFAVGQTSLGAVLVGATEIGICTIQLGDDPAALVRAVQDRFHKAVLIGADAGFEDVVARVVGLVEAPGTGHGLPLDIRGTAFQKRVWDALRAIPAGRPTTYAGLAAAIGHPAAWRAVALACGANPLAVAIPCHRVVRLDGGLSGYRWGIERKRALLAREAGPGR